MQFINQFLQFLQQGIAAIFRFVGQAWSWAFGEVIRLVNLPWATMPLWKQIFMVVVAAGVAYALYRVVMELWESIEAILKAFAKLLGVFVETIPWVVGIGVGITIAIWVTKTF